MKKFTGTDGGPIYLDPSAVTHIKVLKSDIEIYFFGGNSAVVAESLATVLGVINSSKLVEA